MYFKYKCFCEENPSLENYRKYILESLKENVIPYDKPQWIQKFCKKNIQNILNYLKAMSLEKFSNPGALSLSLSRALKNHLEVNKSELKKEILSILLNSTQEDVLKNYEEFITIFNISLNSNECKEIVSKNFSDSFVSLISILLKDPSNDLSWAKDILIKNKTASGIYHLFENKVVDLDFAKKIIFESTFGNPSLYAEIFFDKNYMNRETYRDFFEKTKSKVSLWIIYRAFLNEIVTKDFVLEKMSNRDCIFDSSALFEMLKKNILSKRKTIKELMRKNSDSGSFYYLYSIYAKNKIGCIEIENLKKVLLRQKDDYNTLYDLNDNAEDLISIFSRDFLEKLFLDSKSTVRCFVAETFFNLGVVSDKLIKEIKKQEEVNQWKV